MVAKAFRSNLLARLPHLADVTEITDVVNWKHWLDVDGVPPPDALALRPDRPVLRRSAVPRRPLFNSASLRGAAGGGPVGDGRRESG